MSYRLIIKLKLKYVFAIGCFIMLLDYFGAFTHLFEVTYDDKFVYPYEGNIHEFVNALKHHEKPTVDPINEYNYTYVLENKQKCIDAGYSTFHVVYLVKSALENVERRAAIRNSWGFEKRFFDIPSRTVFLLGVHPADEELQAKVKLEAAEHKDIIQADFIDNYYNNTIKTMMGFKWLMTHCSNSKFYMFVDDDMYVSVKNVLRFIRNPANYPDYLKEPKKFGAHKREIAAADLQEQYYNTERQLNKSRRNRSGLLTVSTDNEPEIRTPTIIDKQKSLVGANSEPKKNNVNINTPMNDNKNLINEDLNNRSTLELHRTKRQVFDFELPEDVRLFAGFVFMSSPHRHKSSKWYVPLSEYPYHLWPPYVTAGAYILSRQALIDMYYTSLYTKHFRLDDIFLGLVAKKANIEPFHCEEFHFYKKDYTKFNYKYVITSHGYGNPNELLYVWNEQKALGNA